MSGEVWAIIVTYNRKELLGQCLAALRRQTRACDKILVIDNASSDGTAEWLATAVSEHLEAYRSLRNTGGAGGFNAGMRIAYQGGADFLWLMDDDVIPRPDALEALLRARDQLNDRGIDHAFVASTAWTPEGLMTNVPDVDHRQNAIQYSDWGRGLDLGLLAIRRATFVSILFPRAVVADHGLPIAPMFIWGDDSEYTVRVTAHRAGYLVGPSSVVHVRAAPGVLSLATEDNSVRIGFHRFLTRNTAYLHRMHYGRRAWLTYSWRQVVDAGKMALGGQIAKAQVLIGGVLDGLSFRPRIEHGGDQGQELDAVLTRIEVEAGSQTPASGAGNSAAG